MRGTLFLPILLDASAVIRSTCPLTGRAVELVVAPHGVTSSRREDLHVSFPAPAATDTTDVIGSFCRKVFFLAGDDAARGWRQTHREGMVLDLPTAYELGRRGIGPMLAQPSEQRWEMSR